ncbi:MAG: hypothetical protein II971_06185 [Firmicutes bacterium]|nr:hypothetical protein [Bacillota bacterium]
MKQLIVLISTVILGIFIASMILGFRSDANTLKGTVDQKLTELNGIYNSTACSEVRA